MQNQQQQQQQQQKKPQAAALPFDPAAYQLPQGYALDIPMMQADRLPHPWIVASKTYSSGGSWLAVSPKGSAFNSLTAAWSSDEGKLAVRKPVVLPADYQLPQGYAIDVPSSADPLPPPWLMAKQPNTTQWIVVSPSGKEFKSLPAAWASEEGVAAAATREIEGINHADYPLPSGFVLSRNVAKYKVPLPDSWVMAKQGASQTRYIRSPKGKVYRTFNTAWSSEEGKAAAAAMKQEGALDYNKHNNNNDVEENDYNSDWDKETVAWGENEEGGEEDNDNSDWDKENVARCEDKEDEEVEEVEKKGEPLKKNLKRKEEEKEVEEDEATPPPPKRKNASEVEKKGASPSAQSAPKRRRGLGAHSFSALPITY
jgi:hypothetical protein